MSSRENILNAVKNNQPELTEMPTIPCFDKNELPVKEQFRIVLEGIGGKVFEVNDYCDIARILTEIGLVKGRCISTVDELQTIANDHAWQQGTDHSLENVQLAIIQGTLGIAENGSIWLPESSSFPRVLPFITEHLVVVLNKSALVSTMHEAYDKITLADYGFGVFIAGPSKTADIEQSLVLGAHGPKEHTVFLMD